MGRPHRAAAGGYVYHVLNRANARMRIFEDDDDYRAFERVLAEAVERTETRLLAYCVMPNHWHLVLWPRHDGELTNFLRWMTHTHTMRWHAHHRTAGTGHVYQGRFKSFPVQTDEYLFSLLRYVERNALRAGLVTEVVPHDRLLEAARAVAASIVGNNQKAVRSVLGSYHRIDEAATQ